MNSHLIRDKVVLPPTGWRKAIPMRVKRAVLERQNYKSAVEPFGELPRLISGAVHFDHRPPLHERPYLEEIDDTVPAANDPEYIFAIPAGVHRQITGQDITRMAKTDRLRDLQADIDRIMTKECGHKRERKGTIRSAGFPKKRKRQASDFGISD